MKENKRKKHLYKKKFYLNKIKYYIKIIIYYKNKNIIMRTHTLHKTHIYYYVHAKYIIKKYIYNKILLKIKIYIFSVKHK